MKVIILGGGLAGLAAADKLLDQKHDVTVLEKENYLGGMASSFEHDGVRIPKHYHHIFGHDYLTQHYLKRYNLYKNIRWTKIKMAIASNRKLYDFTSPKSLLNFNLLSVYGRLRYGLFGLYALRFMNPSNIKNSMDAEAWLLKCAGKEVTSKMFYNLYAKNKFGIPLNMISAKQFAFRLKAGEALGNFGYPPEGLDMLIDGLEKDILDKGGKIKKGYSIKSLDAEKLKVDNMRSDVIISTIPPNQFLKISKNLNESYINKVSKIRYVPCITVAFGTKNFLSKHYWINVFNERVGMIIQHSRLYDGYKEKVCWATRYGGSEQDLDLSDDEIKEEYLKPVKKYFPKAEVVWSKVFKERYAEPIYDKYYALKNPGYRTGVKGLYNAGISITYPKIRNMNTALESGLKVAALIKEDHSS